MPWIDSTREIIETNVYDIPQRLKEIDPGYFAVYNHADHAFEVHHKENKGDTFCLNIPYPELDARTLYRVRETKIARGKIIMKQIEEQQLQRELSASKKFHDETSAKLREIHRYVAPKAATDTIPDDAYSTRFV